MLTDFPMEYSQQTDGELLHLATQRHYLTPEARVALDTELHRRNLTESDRVEHQRFVKRQERRKYGGRRYKLFGKARLSWREMLSAFGVMAALACAYFALPKQYGLKPDWAEAALYVMISSVIVAVGWRSLWRDVAFWIALALSSAIQLAVDHAWVRRAGELNRNAGKLATFLGLGLFIGLYGSFRLLRQSFCGEGNSQGISLRKKILRAFTS
jgi:hypothetical protein